MKKKQLRKKIISFFLLICMTLSYVLNPILAQASELNIYDAVNLLKNQDESDETILKEEATDRFIVKYKEGREEEGKEKIEKSIKSDLKEIKEITNNNQTVNNNSEKMDMKTLATVMQAVVKFKKNKDENELDLIITNKKINQKELMDKLEDNEDIEYIQPDYEIKLKSNDTYFEKQWSLGSENETVTDSVYGLSDESIDANVISAWDESQGEGVTVAVIDTGIDITHEDLSQNIWINKNEIPDNGIDDDNNGYIDDLNGWSFFDKTNVVHNENLTDEELHGTHIAGIIAAQKDNEKGIAGLAPKAKIIPLKVFNEGTAYTSDIIQAIQYAENMGANIVNCSWTETNENMALKEAMTNKNMLFVFAAGNDSINIDENPIFSTMYEGENLITVASINNKGMLSYFSNYGEDSVDIAAPGEDVLSTLPNNEYGLKSGTSMAAPFVSGEAALILSKYKGMEIEDVKERIIKSSDRLSSLTDKVYNSGKVNFYDALTNTINKNTVINIISDNDIKTVTEDVYDYKTVMEEVYGKGDPLPYAIEILYKIEKFSDATKDERETICEYYGIAEEILLECEEKGYSVNQSIEISSTALNYGFTIDEIEKLKTIYSEVGELESELINLNIIIEFKRLTDEEIKKVKELLLQGIPIKDIMSLHINQRSIMLSENIPSQYDPNIKYDKYLSAPFDYASTGSENISTSTGSLIYKNNLLSLPGRNGLDLNINLRYDSSKANLYKAGYHYDIEEHEYMVVYSGTAYAIPYKSSSISSNRWEEDLSDNKTKVVQDEMPKIRKTFKKKSEAEDFIEKLIEEQKQKYDKYNEDYYENIYNYTDKYEVRLRKKYGYDSIDMPLCKEMNLDIFIIQFAEPQIGRYHEVNERDDSTYNEKNSELGAGWSFGFSSIEVEGNKKFLHLGNGASYEINITSQDGDSNLKKYTLKDMRLEDINKTFGENGRTAKYILIYKNGTKEYFDTEGRLIYIVDRYNNRIKFEYDRTNRYPKHIVDTLDRVITIENGYSSVKIITPNTNDSDITITKGDVDDYLEEYDDNHDIIKSIEDQKGRKIEFRYNFQKGNYNFFSKNEDDLYMYDKEDTIPLENIFANLKTIEYPTGASTKYTYEKALGNLGKDGLYEYYRINTRENIDDDTSYNKKTYIYGDDVKQYPIDNKDSIYENQDSGKVTFRPDKIQGTQDVHTSKSRPWQIGYYHCSLVDSDYERGIAIKFDDDDLESIPSNAKILKATLSLRRTANRLGASDNLNVGVYRINTYKGMSAVSSDYHSNDCEAQIKTSYGRNDWDISNLVNRWINGKDRNYGIYLFNTEGSYIKGRKSYAGWHEFEDPELEIEYKVSAKKTINHTGYPVQNNPNSLDDDFIYKTTVETDLENNQYLQTTYYFNNKHLVTKVETKKVKKEKVENEEKNIITYKELESNTLTKIEYSYDGNKLPKEQVSKVYDGSESSTKEVSWVYDDYGDLKEFTDVFDNKTEYTYDPNFHQINNVIKDINKDSKKQEVDYKINPANGNVEEIKQYYIDENNVRKFILTKYNYYDDYVGNIKEKKIQKRMEPI